MAVLYLIPVTLGECNVASVLPSALPEILRQTEHYIVENLRNARRFLKRCGAVSDLDRLTFFELNEHTDAGELSTFIEPLRHGFTMGLLSDAGCPGVADPGADIVRLAHKERFRVIPLVGPSSILLAMMASGMNGQNFAFNGYLPVKSDARTAKIKLMERRIYAESQSQAFIETPYRNLQLFDALLHTCQPQTRLCVAANLTLESEFICAMTVAEWRKAPIPDIGKQPAVFVLGT
ncbi:MAG: SAM-dependent methyltransferase [Bacteroidales bacterium]|jgi:16S rRNA (cytidine1402-2'-O)-methyltransferase|nr:SAM-dependent methyltransferase [Bacteroidales bacterium]